MEQAATIQSGSAIGQRPPFLKIICILSFIGSGLWALLSLFGIFASGFIITFASEFMGLGLSAAENIDPAQLEQAGKAMILAKSMGTGLLIGVFSASLILALVSIFGVAKMWRLNKSGFWLYVIANGIILIPSLLSFNVIGILITGGFIAMYAVNLKHMNNY